MLKVLALFTAAVTLLALAGCDPGPPTFTKFSDPGHLNQMTQLASNIGEDSE